MDPKLIDAIRKWKVVPIITLKSQENVLQLAKTFLQAGLPVLELTLRYPGSEKGISLVRERYPEILVGSGTTLSLGQAKLAHKAGAQFIVSPVLNPDVVKYCLDQGIPIFPGVNNPTHLYDGLCLGVTHFKIFPAEAAGGPSFLKALQGPFPMARFFPTGGINHTNLAPYFELPSVDGVGCGDLSPESVIDQGNWPELTRRIQLYRQAAGLITRHEEAFA